MKNEIKDINEVIIHFLDGTATGEEKVFLFNWLKQSEKNRNEFSEVRDLWLLGNTIATDDLETEIALERFKNRIQSTESGLRKTDSFPETLRSVLACGSCLFDVIYCRVCLLLLG